MPEEKLPQNIQDLITDIGEKTVLFHLYLRLKDTKWEVYKSVGDKGCDIVLINPTNNRKVKIEVKTRQRIYTTSNHNTFHFMITESEYNSCDFLIAYWLEKQYFFIVPKEELILTKSDNRKLYRLTVYEKSDGTLKDTCLKYLDRWDLIMDKLK